MKKRIASIFIVFFICLIWTAVRADEFDKAIDGANYLADYQAKQERNDLISKLLLAGLFAAGGIALAVKSNRKKPPDA